MRQRMTHIPDRLAWAQAVLAEEVEWGFHGVDKPSDRQHGRRDEKKYTHLGWLLVASERYMNDHVSQCADYYMESENDDDWREHCEAKVHRHDCCPHETEAEYKAFVEKMYKDENKRREWAYDRVEVQWEWDQVNQDTTDIDWVMWFLKDHPVDEVKIGDEWLDIDDIAGFCPSCNKPVLSSDIKDALVGDETITTLICPECSHEEPNFDVNGLYNDRPFNWPPGAPWPTYPAFDGTPCSPPPEKEATS